MKADKKILKKMCESKELVHHHLWGASKLVACLLSGLTDDEVIELQKEFPDVTDWSVFGKVTDKDMEAVAEFQKEKEEPKEPVKKEKDVEDPQKSVEVEEKPVKKQGISHKITKEDLKQNPELENEGIKEGDEVTLPSPVDNKKLVMLCNVKHNGVKYNKGSVVELKESDIQTFIENDWVEKQ